MDEDRFEKARVIKDDLNRARNSLEIVREQISRPRYGIDITFLNGVGVERKLCIPLEDWSYFLHFLEVHFIKKVSQLEEAFKKI